MSILYPDAHLLHPPSNVHACQINAETRTSCGYTFLQKRRFTMI